MAHPEYAVRHRTTRRWVATDLRQCSFADTESEAEAFRYAFMFEATAALLMCYEFAGAYEIVPIAPRGQLK